MSLVGAPQVAAVVGISAPGADSPQGTFSATTVQVDGVDEADLVKYDGQLHLHDAPAERAAKPGFTRNVLTIARTDPATAGYADRVGVHGARRADAACRSCISCSRSRAPRSFSRRSVRTTEAGCGGPAIATAGAPARSHAHPAARRARPCQRLAGVGARARWLVARQPQDRRHALSGEQLSAATRGHASCPRTRRNASARTSCASATLRRADLLPSYRENGGARRQLLAAVTACWRPISASTMRTRTWSSSRPSICRQRRITDVNCVSTNVNGVYVSRDSLYVGGAGRLDPGGDVHRAAQVRAGRRRHQLSRQRRGRRSDRLAERVVLPGRARRRSAHRDVASSLPAAATSSIACTCCARRRTSALNVIATLPNSQRTERIGKPGEQVHAVRFFGDRAYVVTARVVDPLYVLDLSEPEDPVIAGTLEIPGVSTYPAAARRGRRGSRAGGRRADRRHGYPRRREDRAVRRARHPAAALDRQSHLRPARLLQRSDERSARSHAAFACRRTACASRCRSTCSPRPRQDIAGAVRLDLLGLAPVRDQRARTAARRSSTSRA